MKKRSVISLLLILLITGITSCSNEDSLNVQTQNDDLQIGMEHNQCLTFVFNKIQALPKSRSGQISVNKKELMKIVEDGTIEYVETLSLDDTLKLSMRNELKKVFNVDEYQTDYYENCSISQKEYIDKLSAIMDDNDYDLGSLKNRINILRTTAKKKLIINEYEEFSSACDVAENTLQYWHDNADQWIATSPQKQSRAGSRFSWKELGKSDVVGAVAGATCAVARTIFRCGPVGWKAWAGWVVGAAAAHSAANAVNQLW